MNDVFSFGRVLRITQCLLHPPGTPKHYPSLNLHDAIVSACLDDLTIETGWPKDSPDDFLIELKPVRGNQWNLDSRDFSWFETVWTVELMTRN